MKAAVLALTCFACCAGRIHANVRIDFAGQIPVPGAGNQPPAISPQTPLQGESVYARLEKAGTSVEAIFALPVGPGSVQAVYFPVFAAPGSSIASILERSRFYAHLDGVQLTEVEPVSAPKDAPKAPAGTAVFWFKFSAAPEQMSQLPGNEFRISYWQPHIASAFHYLPQSLPTQPGGKRDWRYQIVIRSLTAQIPALPTQVDFERVGDLVFLYPRDGQIVRVPVARSG
jgi:hypothetical protein